MQRRRSIYILCVGIASVTDESKYTQVTSLARGVVQRQSIVIVGETKIRTARQQKI